MEYRSTSLVRLKIELASVKRWKITGEWMDGVQLNQFGEVEDKAWKCAGQGVGGEMAGREDEGPQEERGEGTVW